MILTKRTTLYRSQNGLYVNNFELARTAPPAGAPGGPSESPRRVGGFRGSPLNRIGIMQ